MPQDPQSTAALALLVRRAQQGDREAEARLLSALEPVVRGFFMRRVPRHAELDDLVQNTLLRVFKGMGEIKDGARVRAFALKAALFELQDLFRGRYGSRESLLSEDLPEHGTVPDEAGLGIDIERALGTLSEKAREIINLKVLGFKYEEIASQLGTTEAAVKMQVKRALERLRTALDVVTLLILPSSGLLLSYFLGRLIL